MPSATGLSASVWALGSVVNSEARAAPLLRTPPSPVPGKAKVLAKAPGPPASQLSSAPSFTSLPKCVSLETPSEHSMEKSAPPSPPCFNKCSARQTLPAPGSIPLPRTAPDTNQVPRVCRAREQPCPATHTPRDHPRLGSFPPWVSCRLSQHLLLADSRSQSKHPLLGEPNTNPPTSPPTQSYSSAPAHRSIAVYHDGWTVIYLCH